VNIIEVIHSSIRYELEVDIEGIADFLLEIPPLLSVCRDWAIPSCL
jgi:hypothetical protein